MRSVILALFLSVGPGFALAQTATLDAPAPVVVPQSQQQIAMSFAPVVRKAAPAVVNIYAARRVRESVSPFMNDPFFAYMFGQQFDLGVPRSRVEQALGSGVIVRPNGIVVTNRHVVKDASEVKVVLSDRREFPAEVTLVDEKTDLAVLRINAGGNLPTLPLGDSDALQVGDLVLAIGNPFGVGQTVTSGIVSATARAAEGINDYGYFIQTDAAINPGNSGGALVDMQGRLIGINTAIYSRSGGSLGIGFAIPVSMVKTVIDAGASGQRVVRPWLGVRTEPVTSEIASSLGLQRPQGVLVKALQPQSPLAQAGVKVGDIITGVAGQDVDSPEALSFRVGTQSVGSEATFSVLRRGSVQAINIKLVAAPETPERQQTVITGNNPYAGATVVNISPAVIDEMGLDMSLEDGVVITKVSNRNIAAQLGFQAGDVPLQINGQAIGNVDDLVSAVKSQPRLWRLKIRRGDQVITTVVGG